MKKLLLFLWLISGYCSANEDVVYRIKASYIYNFLQFIEFQHSNADNLLTVCIVGENRFGDSLKKIQGEETPHGKITISNISHKKIKDNIGQCKVVYIVGVDEHLTSDVMQMVDTSSVLTIGESSSFIENGGFIELFIEDDNIRFRINRSLVGNTKFKVPAQVLQLGLQS